MSKWHLLMELAVVLMLVGGAISAFGVMVFSFFSMWDSDIHLLIFVVSGWCLVWSNVSLYRITSKE